MFRTEDTYVNRYGDEYYFSVVPKSISGLATQYYFKMEGDSMKWARWGGKEGQKDIDLNDLGMFDPSGGPYITLGMTIDGKKITRIADLGKEGIVLEVAND
jgi:hypothetical protein